MRFLFPRHVLALVLFALGCGSAVAQRQMEDLNRGLVAFRKSSTQVYLSWRLFGNDPPNVAFNLYRSVNNGAPNKLNAAPITATTDYTDTPGTTNLTNNPYAYFVRPVINGVEQGNSETVALPANPPQKQFLSVPLRADTGPNGPYTVKFCWVGDLDGDGDYDYVVDRLSTQGAFEQFLEAYTNDGSFLWRMAMGPNSVNQYLYEPGSSAVSIGDTDNVTVYDMDGDGKAEVLVRTANGVTVTNAAGLPVATITAANNSTQFLSVIDGGSGVELGRATMPNAWAVHGTLTNKAMIAYLDGKRPSVVMYGYNRADTNEFYRQFTAFDFRNGALTQRWTLPQTFPGAEGHQIRIADVDNDGKDEICDIGHVIDDNGTQLFRNELTHGDRFHIADINPDRPGLETFAIQQYNPTSLATALYESGTGSMIKKWYANSPVDVGRGIALELSSVHKGYEMYSTQPGIFNAKGEQIYNNNPWAPEGLWWDGDLAREFIDGAGSGALNPTIDKFNATTGNKDRFWTLYNDWGDYSTTQAYGGRPAFWGDILGDWREELVLLQSDFAALRIYTTAIAATNRLYTLMHNPQYRCQATTKGYVQASYVDYYLGYGMNAEVPPPPMTPATLAWAGGMTWDVGGTAAWKNAAGVSSRFAQGDSVLFDLSGANALPVALSGTLTPASVAFYNPQDFVLNGSGSFSGGMTLSKSGAGTTTLTGTHGFTGATTIWDGALQIDGRLSSSPVTVWGGIWGGALATGETGGRLAGSGIVSQPVTVGYRGAITPGAGMDSAATLQLGSQLSAADGSVLALDLSDDPTGVSKPNDRITVAGNLSLSGTVTICINVMDGALAPGTYTLLTYGGALGGSLSNLAIKLPEGTAHTLSVGSGAINLVVPVTRAPASLTWTGGLGGNVWDLFSTRNWSRSGTPDSFVAADTVTFNDAGSENPTVNLTTALPTGGVTVDCNSDYDFTGTGAVAGAGGLTKSGGGTLTLSTTNTYTGPTTVTGGTLAIENLGDAGNPSSIGAAGSAASNLVINGGTLALVGEQTSTNRSLTLGSAGGTLAVPPSTSLQISGSLVGSGSLTKTGAGTLILASTNTHAGGTFIREGVVSLASDATNISGLGSGLVTLNGGTLSMTNSTGGSAPVSAWSLHVPTGFSGRLNADGRSTLTGALTGGGDFTFHSPFVRTGLAGNWSAFTGRIWVIADGDGGDLRLENTAGYPSARLDLGNSVYAYYNLSMGGNLTIPIGALSGSSSAVLLGGPTSGRTLTWQVGARNEDSSYAGVITNGTGPTALTKVGAGTLALAGANTYSGTTTVSAGRLQVNGSSSATNYTVQNGATLGGSGSITGNLTVQTGGALEHRASGSTSLAITGNLTLPSSVVVRPAAGAAAVGTYTVLTYSGTLTGTPVFTWEAPAGSFLVASFNTSTAGVISMTLEAPPRFPGPITWTGAASFNWNTGTDNWAADSVATSYQTGDTPSFTEPGPATSAINIVANVQPAGVVVNAAKNYTFSGSGAITGEATLTKSGAGTLTLTGIHAIGGVTSISGGTLAITQTGSGGSAIGAVLGSGPIVLSGGGTFRMGSANGKNFPSNPVTVPPSTSGSLSSATLANVHGGSLTGASDSILTLSGPISLGVSGSPQLGGFLGTVVIPSGSQLRFSSTSGPNGNGGSNTTFQVDGTINTRNAGGAGGAVLGALTGGGSLQGQSNTPAGTVIYQIGSKNINSVFSGIITNSASGTVALNKVGSATLTLSGPNTYTGATTVFAGKLTVSGSLDATATTVATTGALGGNGSIAGAVTCHGILAPGNATGTLSLGSGLILSSTSTLECELGTSPDLVAVTGALTLDGTLNVTAAPGFGAGTYTLISYTGALTNNTLDIGGVPPGFIATVNTATTGRVRLIVTVIPVPATITLGRLIQTYDGSEKSVSVTTDPVELSHSVTYNDSLAKPTEPGTYSVVATITDPNYQGAANGSLVIEPGGPTWASWRDGYFSELDQNAGLAAENADPDADSLTNLGEYALGTHPRQFTAPLTAIRDAGGLSLTFTRPAGLLDVTYGAESTGDFGTWSPLLLEVLNPGSNPESVRARDPLTTGDPAKRFIRLRFEK